MGQGCGIAEAMDTLQARAFRCLAYLEFERRPQVGRVVQFLVPYTGFGAIAVLPEAYRRSEIGELGALRKIDAEAGAENDVVSIQDTLGGIEPDRAIAVRNGSLYLYIRVEESVRMAGYPQRAHLRRWHLLLVDVVPKSPFPRIRQLPIAVSHPGADRTLALIHAWNFS